MSGAKPSDVTFSTSSTTKEAPMNASDDIVSPTAAPLDPTAVTPPLDGGGLLLVEDEALIAFEAEDLLRELGAESVTVCSSFATAQKAVEETAHAYAVFDLNLNGKLSTPLIERFVERGGRAVIATGYELEESFVARLGAIHLIKPYNGRRLREALTELSQQGRV